MEAGDYAINSIGTKVAGASGAIEVQLSGIAKDDDAEPYSVVNEMYVPGCGRPRASRASGKIAKTVDGKNMFVSLLFTADG